MDFESFSFAVIRSEGPTLEASTALLGRKKIEGWTKISKIEKRENFIGKPSESKKLPLT